MNWRSNLLVIVVLVTSSSCEINFDQIRSTLSSILQENKKHIPDQVVKWVAVLQDSMDIWQKCLPRTRVGNCYKSNPCRLPKIKYDVSIVLSICRKPWIIRIDFGPIEIHSLAKVESRPLIIKFQDHPDTGRFTIHSDTTIKVRVKYINFGIAKARFIIDGTLRYDCTKPRGINKWKQRGRFNLQAPRSQYNAVFYNLRIRLELKKKRFNWFKFDYKCIRCEDLLKKTGTVGQVGPQSCVADTNRYLRQEIKERLCRRGALRHRCRHEP